MTNEQAQAIVIFLREKLLAGMRVSATGDRVLEAQEDGTIFCGLLFEQAGAAKE